MSPPESVVIRDPDSQSEAEVLVGYGFNCFRFETHLDGHRVDVLWADDDFRSAQQRPSGSGIPILFPFPGRIQGTSFQWEGRTYALDDGDGLGNAIHGFVHCRPWRTVARSEQSIVGEFQASVDDPSLLQKWPSDYRVRAEYRLQSRCLQFQCDMQNCGDVALPCGFGTHPYFKVPLTAQGVADKCRVRIPISASWELVDMNATGKVDPLANAAEFQSGLQFADVQVDNVFTGLVPTDGVYRSSVSEPQSGLAVQMEFDDIFRECVVYTPGHREAICIEPYTCVPDAFRLERDGIDAGMRILEPGESFSAQIKIEVTRAK